MTISKLSRLTKKPPHSMSTQETGVNSRPYQSAIANTKAAPAGQSSQFVKTVSTVDSMKPLNLNISAPILSAKPTESKTETHFGAAAMLKIGASTLLTLGLIQIGRDPQGNMVIVLPRQHWNEEMRLK